MADAFDPYLRWLGIRDPERPPNHYRLLGVTPFEEDADVLGNAADRQMSHVRTFQTGLHSAESQQLLNELAAAKICLLNAEKKTVYDAELRARPAREAVAPPSPPVEPPSPSWLDPPVAAPAPPSNVFLETPIVVPEPRRPKAVRSSRRDFSSVALVATLLGVLALLILWLIFLWTRFNESKETMPRKSPAAPTAATHRLFDDQWPNRAADGR